MVFQWFWSPKPLVAMVFQWFWVQKPLVAMVFQWFPMVANHWSDDGMVTIHRSGLAQVVPAQCTLGKGGHLNKKVQKVGKTKPPLIQKYILGFKPFTGLQEYSD